MSLNFKEMDLSNTKWRAAVYNGRPIFNLLVSDCGAMRRIDKKTGLPGPVSFGIPNYNKENGNRMRQMMVSVNFGKGENTTVNLHRVILCTFKDVVFGKGEDVDHIDMNPANGSLENLRKLTHRENTACRNLREPSKTSKSPIASQYRHAMCLRLNVKRVADLPHAVFNEYHRLKTCEYQGRPAIPRRISL